MLKRAFIIWFIVTFLVLHLKTAVLSCNNSLFNINSDKRKENWSPKKANNEKCISVSCYWTSWCRKDYFLPGTFRKVIWGMYHDNVLYLFYCFCLLIYLSLTCSEGGIKEMFVILLQTFSWLLMAFFHPICTPETYRSSGTKS